MGSGGSKEVGSTKTEIPQWVQHRYKDVFGKENKLYDTAKGVAKEMDPREVLGLSDMEKRGLEEALGGLDAGEFFLDQASDFSGIDQALANMGLSADQLDTLAGDAYGLSGFTTDRIGDKSLDEMRESYESDYTDDVVDTTLAGQDRQRARERAAAQAQNMAIGGASNTRGAIGQAVSDQLYGINRASTEAGLRDEAFRTAAELGQSEAQMGQAEDQMNYDFAAGGLDLAGGLTGDKAAILQSILSGESDRQQGLEGLSSGYAGLGTARGGVLSDFGAQDRGLDQEQLDATRTHNMDMTNWLSAILGQNKTTDSNAGGSTTTKSEAAPSAGQTLLGLGTTLLGGWLSDENAKEDITDAPDGALDAISALQVKDYRYRDDAPGHRKDRHRGLIAQDVEDKIPGATYRGKDGLLRIDPFPVAATIVQSVAELEEKRAPWKVWQKNSGIAT